MRVSMRVLVRRVAAALVAGRCVAQAPARADSVHVDTPSPDSVQAEKGFPMPVRAMPRAVAASKQADSGFATKKVGGPYAQA